MAYTKEQLYEFFSSATPYFAPEEPPVPEEPVVTNTFNTRTAKITVHDVRVYPSTKVARVPITLSETTNQTLLFRILTQNGDAREGAHFQRVDKYLTFEPGEKNKIIDIPLNADITGLYFRLNAIQVQGWDGTAIPAFNDNAGLIYGAGVTGGTTPVVEAYSYGLTPKPSGLTLDFEETFTNFQCTDSGFLSDGTTPCWRSRMGFGRLWTNDTIAPAVDPVLNPGTTPWKRVNNVFSIQSEHLPGQILYDGNTFDYTMPMITTQRNYDRVKVGCYVEAKMTMPLVPGSWPALWLLTNKPNQWPLLELDMFEGFFSGSAILAKVGTTVHWKTQAGNHGQYGIKLPHTGIDIAQSHVWGMWWGEKHITFYVDEKPYFAVPNIWLPEEQAYIKIDIAVGGQAGTPNSANWPVNMPIEWLRVWR